MKLTFAPTELQNWHDLMVRIAPGRRHRERRIIIGSLAFLLVVGLFKGTVALGWVAAYGLGLILIGALQLVWYVLAGPPVLVWRLFHKGQHKAALKARRETLPKLHFEAQTLVRVPEGHDGPLSLEEMGLIHAMTNPVPPQRDAR